MIGVEDALFVEFADNHELRIAILTTSYPTGPDDPAGHFVAAEAEALVRAGHHVTVVCPGCPNLEGANPCVVRLADGGACGLPGLSARLRERPARALGLLAWMLRARRELTRRGPFDRVVAHWLVPAGFPIAASLGGASDLEVVVHGSDARLVARLPFPMRAALFSALARRGATLRCVSEELRELITHIAPSGSVTARVEPAAIRIEPRLERADARLALGLAAELRLVLVVSRLLPEKRVREALSAALRVPKVSIAVIGDGPERLALEAEFPQVRFLGFLARPRTLTWIAAADALLSASRKEGAPTVVREARALGTPVVALEAGDLTRWAAHDPGLWVIR